MLLDCLNDGDGDVRKRAASSLEVFVDDPIVVDAIGSRLCDSCGSNGNLAKAIRSLSAIARISNSKRGSEHAKTYLLKATESEHEWIRQKAKQELGIIHLHAVEKDIQIAQSTDENKKKKLLSLLSSRDSKKRGSAFERLIQFPNDRVVIDALGSRLDDGVYTDPNLLSTYMGVLVSDNLEPRVARIAQGFLKESSQSKVGWIQEMALDYLGE